MRAGYILVVDDDPQIREIVGLMLGKLGYRFELRASAAEALALCEEAPEAPAFIFLDLRMPGMSGLEALQRLRAGARTRNLPIVCISGEPYDDAQARAAGFTGLVGKPFRARQLTEALATFAPALSPEPLIGDQPAK